MQSNLSVSNMLNLDFESVLKNIPLQSNYKWIQFFLLLVLLSWIKINKNLMHHIWWIWCNFLCIRRGTDPNWSFYLKFLFNGLRCHFNYINIKKKTNPIYLGLFLNVSIVSSWSIHVLSSLFLFFFSELCVHIYYPIWALASIHLASVKYLLIFLWVPANLTNSLYYQFSHLGRDYIFLMLRNPIQEW